MEQQVPCGPVPGTVPDRYPELRHPRLSAGNLTADTEITLRKKPGITGDEETVALRESRGWPCVPRYEFSEFRRILDALFSPKKCHRRRRRFRGLLLPLEITLISQRLGIIFSPLPLAPDDCVLRRPALRRVRVREFVCVCATVACAH